MSIKSIDDLADDLAELKARTAKLLREIEWSGDDGGQERGSPCCPKCGAVQATKWAKTPTPHLPDCALAALLREAEAP